MTEGAIGFGKRKSKHERFPCGRLDSTPYSAPSSTQQTQVDHTYPHRNRIASRFRSGDASPAWIRQVST